MSLDDDSILIFLTIAVVLILLFVAWPLAHSFFGAQAFNRLTGEDATAWDALWVELRVGCN